MPIEDRDRIEILGQRVDYPRTWQAAVAVAVVVLIVAITTVAIVWIVMVRASETRVHEIAGLVLEVKTFNRSGALEESKQGKLVQFWSPSAETCASLRANYGALQPDQQWQCLPSDEPVKRFGSAMIARFGSRLNGYRRWKVAGHGRTTEKDGTWWVLNVDKNFVIPEFVRFYSDYWKNEKAVYIEEISGRQGFVDEVAK
jgi:hypothetical protein